MAGAAVLLVKAVELVARQADFAGAGGHQLVAILVDGHFQLAGFDRLLHQHLFGVAEGLVDGVGELGHIGDAIGSHRGTLTGRLDEDGAPAAHGLMGLGVGGPIVFTQEDEGGIGNAQGGEPQLGAHLVKAELASFGATAQVGQAGQFEEGLQIAGLAGETMNAGHHIIDGPGVVATLQYLVHAQMARLAIRSQPAIGLELDPRHFYARQGPELLFKKIGTQQGDLMLAAATTTHQQYMVLVHR